MENAGRLRKVLVLAVVFILGFTAAQALSYVQISEKPLSLSSFSSLSSLSIIGESFGSPIAPSSSLDANDIEIYDNKIIINIANSSLSRYADTGSMIPVLNENSKGIKIPVISPEQIHIGDIITYRDRSGDLVIHRIVSIGFDEKETFYITKGDNNFIADNKIRFEQIKYKLIALVY